MYRPSIDDMFEGKESRYALVIGVAKRAREIADNMIRNKEKFNTKPVILAIDDFKNHKYNIIEPEVND